jgi:hypothetical protein
VVGELTGATHTIRVRSRWVSIRKMTAGQSREDDAQG